MLRRAIRLGLTVGVLVGIAVAVAKLLGKRSLGPEPASEPSAPWPRLEPDPGLHEPPATTSLLPDPDAPHTSNGAPKPAPAPATAAAEATTTKAPAAKAPAAKAPAAKKAAKKAAAAPAATTAWVEPTGDVCPTTHPVKGKLTSKIFHLPGMLNYERTRPDRCYRDGDAAEADGLRPAKR